MASSQAQQPTAQSPFKLFSRVGWGKGGKKPKQGSFGEENNMYYHPELKRWVERGKEEEAEREAAGPPPPPVLSRSSMSSGISHKRSLSQRYVLQPNLSVSSSMASLAGSLSYTDLASLAGGQANAMGSFSGPASAIGSTTPSPPQSSSCLAAFPSGPSSSNGMVPSSSFFVPAPPQRATSQGSFFVPTPKLNGDPAEVATQAGESMVSGEETHQGGNAPAASNDAHINGNHAREHVREQVQSAPDGMQHDASVQQPPASQLLEGDTSLALMPSFDPHYPPTLAPLSTGASDDRTLGTCISFSSNLRNPQMDSPVALDSPSGGIDSASGSQAFHEALLTRMSRRRGVGAIGTNASDGGAAISLHEGMGVAPVALRQGPSEEREPESGEAAEGDPAAAVVLGEGVVEEPSTAVGASAETQAVGAGSETGAPGAGASLYSQYYYQQYAHLYQYALGQGYGEAEAVSYAHYYAATYAAQYEAQAPDGQIGSSGTEAGDVTAEGHISTGVVASEHTGSQGGGELAAASLTITSFAAEQQGQTAVASCLSSEVIIGSGGYTTWEVPVIGDEASAVVVAGGCKVKIDSEVSEVAASFPQSPDAAVPGPTGNIVVPSQPPCAQDVPLAVHPVAPVIDDIGLVRAAPLAPELTAAAAAATQHHQSAVTAVVAAAAAAVQATAGSRTAGLAVVTPAADVSQAVETAAAVQPSSGAQLLLRGLGAAGARHLTQLSSAASAAVASLGASVAASAPLAAALSAAATSAAAVAGRAYENGLSEDDFDRIMHPGDAAKLDGPLPWELPDHLRTDRKFLTFCANWHLGNPGKAYAPHMLLQAYERQQKQQLASQKREVGTEAQPRPVDIGDAAPAAESGVLPSGEAGTAVDAGPVSKEPHRDEVSTYERACSFSQFGEPAATLLPQASPRRHKETAVVRKPSKYLFVSIAEEMKQQHDAAPIVISPVHNVVVPHVPAPLTHVSGPPALDLAAIPIVDSPTVHAGDEPTPGSARSDDPYAGAEHIPLAQQLLAVPSPLSSPVRQPHRRVTLEEVTEESPASSSEGSAQVECLEPRAASASATGSQPLGPMGAVEAASFFENLGEEAVEAAHPREETESEGTPATEARAPGTDAADETPSPASTTVAAAAAIDSVVQALELLRGSAISAGVETDNAITDRTALLQHIHSSLAQATAALAGMGLDINALATLAGAADAQEVQPVEWTPGPGSKRPRVHDSPSTPTRPTTGPVAPEGVVTPLLPPGPPVQRTAPCADGAAAEHFSVTPNIAPGERFQLLSRRLSDASNEGLVAGTAASALPPLPQLPVVVQLSVVEAPAVDEAAVVERVRVEERTAWEARIEAVIDSERESAALVIASVEQDRDGLAARVGELEKQLAVVVAERDALAQRLASAKAEAAVSLSEARSQATAERAALSAQLTAAEAAREELGGQLAAERAEKEALAAALSTARSETEELRQRYAERFASLSSELAATRGSLAELQAEHDELLLCLGQESTKVVVLTDALRDAGSDPEPLIQRIEAEYETMGIGAEGQGEDEQGSGDGWEGEELGV